MRLLRSVGTIVGRSCTLAHVAASQGDSRPAEVQRLQFYVGSWDEAGEMRDDPSKPFKPVTGGETCNSYDAAGRQYHVHGTEKPGNNIHAVGRLGGDRWIWVTDPAPDGSQVRYTFAPAGAGARTLTVEVGVGERWSGIVNITYTPRN